jgi:hypothetical protein
MTPAPGNPLVHLPLVPELVLKRHRVNEPLDTRFRSAARLLQALYREEHKLPIGTYVNEDGEVRKLGSRISKAAGHAGGNFLSAEIFQVARREVNYRERGAMIDTERLACNLLSSMPLAFNLLAPWAVCLDRAQGYLIELLPAFIGNPTKLIFEHAPDRGNPKFTGDYTAFDALITYTDASAQTGFVALEIKYAESMAEPPAKLTSRYVELSEACGLFVDPAAAALQNNPLQQLWREAMLAQSMLLNHLYDQGYFVLIYPELNYHAQEAAEAFQKHLCEPRDGKVRFVNLTLEDVIAVLRFSDEEHAEALHDRYCEWWKIDREIEQRAPKFGLPIKPKFIKPKVI